MAKSGPGIPETLSCFRDEFPVIALGMQRELEHSKCVIVSSFALRLRPSHRAMGVLAAAAYHKFANAMCGVRLAIWILRSEPLVAVVMTSNDHIRAAVVKSIPQGLHRRIITVLGAGTE